MPRSLTLFCLYSVTTLQGHAQVWNPNYPLSAEEPQGMLEVYVEIEAALAEGFDCARLSWYAYVHFRQPQCLFQRAHVS